MTLPVALQLFSVRESMEKNAEETLREIKNIGYDGIETCGTYGMEPQDYRNLCDSIGLRIISAHVSTGDIIDETEKTLEIYKTLGVSYLAIAAFWGDYQYGKADYASMIKRLDKCSKIFKDNGIQILYHNHEWEFKKTDNGEYELDRIFADVSDDNLLPELDVCWVTVGHGDTPGYMRKYHNRCPVVHLKDFYLKGDYSYESLGYKRPDDFELRPVGYGRVDMTEVLSTSIEINAKWVVVEQDKPSLGLTELEGVSLSRKWLKNLGW